MLAPAGSSSPIDHPEAIDTKMSRIDRLILNVHPCVVALESNFRSAITTSESQYRPTQTTVGSDRSRRDIPNAPIVVWEVVNFDTVEGQNPAPLNTTRKRLFH